jgi:hypothetical protein
MKFIMECEVEADTILSRDIELRNGPRRYHFGRDEHGRWNSLKVVADVPDPRAFQWGLEPAPGPIMAHRAPSNVRAAPDPELIKSVINDMQCLEASDQPTAA